MVAIANISFLLDQSAFWNCLLIFCFVRSFRGGLHRKGINLLSYLFFFFLNFHSFSWPSLLDLGQVWIARKNAKKSYQLVRLELLFFICGES